MNLARESVHASDTITDRTTGAAATKLCELRIIYTLIFVLLRRFVKYMSNL